LQLVLTELADGALLAAVKATQALRVLTTTRGLFMF
jgi:hypothetical protein